VEAWRSPWNATCRILVGSLTLILCSGAPPPMSKCFVNLLESWALLDEDSFLDLNWSLKVEDHLWNQHYCTRSTWMNTTCMTMYITCRDTMIYLLLNLVSLVKSWWTTLLNLTLITNSWTRLFPWASFSLTWSRLLAQIIQLGLNQWQASSHLIQRVILTMLS
jgi:hypothetical protein